MPLMSDPLAFTLITMCVDLDILYAMPTQETGVSLIDMVTCDRWWTVLCPEGGSLETKCLRMYIYIYTSIYVCVWMWFVINILVC